MIVGPPGWWVKPALVACGVLVAVAAYAGLAWQVSSLKKDNELLIAAEQAASAAADGWQRTAAATQVERNKEGEHARKTLEALDEERSRSAAAQAGAAALRGDVEQLRADARRFAAVRRGAAASDPADAGRGPAACAGADLLADLLAEMAAAGAELAAEADRRGIAGSTCERERDTLTDPSSSIDLPAVRAGTRLSTLLSIDAKSSDPSLCLRRA